MAAVLTFFKENKDNWYSVAQVSTATKRNLRTVRTNLKRMAKHNLLETKSVVLGGKAGTCVMYRYMGDNDVYAPLRMIHKQAENVRNRNVMPDYMTTHVLTAMLIDEVRQLSEKLDKLTEENNAK